MLRLTVSRSKLQERSMASLLTFSRVRSGTEPWKRGLNSTFFGTLLKIFISGKNVCVSGLVPLWLLELKGSNVNPCGSNLIVAFGRGLSFKILKSLSFGGTFIGGRREGSHGGEGVTVVLVAA